MVRRVSMTLSEIRRSTVAVAAVSVVTFGVGTVAIGMVAGAAIGAGFGAFNAYVNGDSVEYGMASGAIAGAVLGTILGGLAEIVYEIQMAPTFDDYYHFD